MSASVSTTRRGTGWLRELMRPELALVLLMAVVIAMLIIPLPTILVDLLIGLNMAIAIVIFLSSFYVERILNFSTFPSVLLFTTLMRLALSVSTSRLILVDADAGHIVSAFGEFVVADNLVVGFVIFAIVTVVQFIVITKGSERIGEVVARFSLDGMPGKQMGIDADLRAEAIDAKGAQIRRREVEKESQLYGSFDGAMKFVKGDAIAGIIIVFVNLFGGIGVGMLQHQMSFEQALKTFTLLTIGDGLVAQIPALLICISAGFVVTRVGGESKNLGAGILTELFGSNLILVIAAGLLLLMGLLPGFPFVVFLVLALGLLGLLAWRTRSRPAGEDGNEQATVGADGEVISPAAAGTALTHDTVPLLLLLPQELMQAWKAQNMEGRLKDTLFIELGLRCPPLVVRADPHARAHAITVLINEVPAGQRQVLAGHARLLGEPDELKALGAGQQVARLHGGEDTWVPLNELERFSALGHAARSDFEELFQAVQGALLRNIGELFGIQETKHVLDEMERRAPELVKETYRHMPVQRVAEVFQRLLREGVSIRNLKIILETLAQWGQREKDVILLVEHVRGALARYISARFAQGQQLAALVLSPQTEDFVRQGIRQNQNAAFLNLDPVQADELMDRIALGVEEVNQRRADVVLLVAPDTRRFVKRFIEHRLPDTAVLSFAEISDAIRVDVMKTL